MSLTSKNKTACPYCDKGKGYKDNFRYCHYCENTGFNKDTTIYRYISYDKVKVPTVGYFRPVVFSPIDNNRSIEKQGYYKTSKDTVFCFVLSDENWEGNWKLAKQMSFKIRKKIDFQKMVDWYEKAKLTPHTKISQFFII